MDTKGIADLYDQKHLGLLALEQLARQFERAPRRRVMTSHGRNGDREVARRLRQIAAGRLTAANGLVA